MPTVGAAEESGPGVIAQFFQAAQAEAVATGQLPRILKDVLAHRTRQHVLQIIHNIHAGLQLQSETQPPPQENQTNLRLKDKKLPLPAQHENFFSLS